VKRLADEIVDDISAVELGGVDVADPVRDGVTQYGLAGLGIGGRTKLLGPASCMAPKPTR
jgi:hypothetical protein